MMTFRRFRALTQSYGANLQRWPQEERADAEELLRSSAQARALHDLERSLDEVIAAVSAREQAARWPEGAEEAALARLRTGVAKRIALEQVHDSPQVASARPAEAAPQAGVPRQAVYGRPADAASGAGAPRWLLSWLFGGEQDMAALRRRRLGLATSGALAIVAGLWVGVLYSPVPAPASGSVLTALLQPATLEILAD